MYKNKSAYHADLASLLKQTAEHLGQSVEWLKVNCANHGIKLPNIEECCLYDFNGREALKLTMYKLKNLFKTFFYSTKRAGEVRDEVPSHLIQIKVLSDFADKEFPKFEKKLQKWGVVDIDFDIYEGVLKEYQAIFEETLKQHAKH